MKGPQSPRSLGFRMPAEWEHQYALWTTWPTHSQWWKENREEIVETFAEIAFQAARFQHVNILCPKSAQGDARQMLETKGAKLKKIRFFDIPTDDVWIRDNGPIFLRHRKEKEMALIDWEFNAWGEKYPAIDNDNRVPAAIADHVGIPRFRFALCVEGGAIESNGRGLLLSTKSVMLNQARNYDVSLEEYQKIFYHALAVDKVIWLENGLAHDNTDGHIDNVARFVSHQHIVIATVKDKKHPSFRALHGNRTELSGTMVRGHMLKITELPLPDPVQSQDGILSASYLNYVILNGAVLVPQFGQIRKDKQAIEIIGGLFPGREIIGIDCRTLIEEGGGLHCCTCNAF